MSELQKQILALPISERLKLISFIASSISPEDLHLPQEWIDEALDRNAVFTSGKKTGYTWDEVNARIHGE